ncbi:MAG: restriction endonuclease subunit S [Prevotellaceae bacterium]|nr:restriction endonuclease subunit S [Prevotellaceae bacterium]
MNETTTKIFPYLERLLDGEEVEWKTLGEVCDYEQPTAYLVRNTNYSDQYPIPVLTAGKTFILGYTNETTGIYRASEHPTILFDDFTTANKWVDFDFKAKSSAMKMLTSKDEKVCLLKYIFYWLNTLPADSIVGDHSRQWISNYAQKSFPVPPLRVQARIVEILDKFTQLEAQLEAELQAELEARKKQYAYYRDQLLNFLQYPPLNVNIEWRTLGEVMEIVTDFTAAGSFASNAQNVRYLQEPNYALLVRTTDIKQGFKSTEKFIYVDQHAFEYLWRVNLDKECIILPNVGNCGEVYHSSPTILPYKNCVLGPNAILVRSEKASNKFLYYLFQAEYFQKELAKITSNAGQGKFNKTNLKQIKLPIPPLSEQRRIVDILDRFDTLTNSISEGLPKEIALRRKQYEYYRDALLNFPRAEVTA